MQQVSILDACTAALHAGAPLWGRFALFFYMLTYAQLNIDGFMVFQRYGFDLTAVSLPGTRAAPGGELHSVPALEAYVKPSGNPTPRSKISTDSSFFSTFAANNKVAIGVSGVLLAFAFHQTIQLWFDI